jgi:hypothetical protein
MVDCGFPDRRKAGLSLRWKPARIVRRVAALAQVMAKAERRPGRVPSPTPLAADAAGLKGME